MKKVLLISLAALAFCSCEEQPTTQAPVPERKFKIESYFKVVKNTKEKTEQHTDYTYKMDWLNGKMRHQPDIHTETKYYVVYTDGSYDEISMSESVVLSPGDTVKKTRQIPL